MAPLELVPEVPSDRVDHAESHARFVTSMARVDPALGYHLSVLINVANYTPQMIQDPIQIFTILQMNQSELVPMLEDARRDGSYAKIQRLSVLSGVLRGNSLTMMCRNSTTPYRHALSADRSR
jgi:hypothetical protein